MTTGLSAARGAVVVQSTRTVDSVTGEALWTLYAVAFEEMRTRAASRHWLSPAEFELEALDSRVTKHVAWREGRPVGLATVTTDLAAAPWISPEFYTRRYPEHAARRGIHYCNLALVHPEERGTDTFGLLVASVAEAVAQDRGVLAADMCRANVDGLGLADAVTDLLRRSWGDARPVELDRQVFLAWEAPPTRALRAVPSARPGDLP